MSDIKKGFAPVALIERDLALIKDYEMTNDDGTFVYTLTDLIGKYKIGTTRIYQILTRRNVVRRDPNYTKPIYE